jgi:hypothetical protein
VKPLQVLITLIYVYPVSAKERESKEKKGVPLFPTHRRCFGLLLLLIRGSKAGPSKGFNSRLRALGLAPTTGQRFEGRPLGRIQRPPQATRAPRPLLIRGS